MGANHYNFDYAEDVSLAAYLRAQRSLCKASGAP